LGDFLGGLVDADTVSARAEILDRADELTNGFSSRDRVLWDLAHVSYPELKAAIVSALEPSVYREFPFGSQAAQDQALAIARWLYSTGSGG